MTDIIELRSHRDRNISARKWNIKRLIPQNGIGLISGQWGSGKTTVALELAAAVAMNGTFARLPIKRQGITLFFALEGIDIVQSTLEALSIEKYDGKRIRMYYTGEPIKLLDQKGVDRAIQIAKAAMLKADKEERLPLVMIVFDTVMMAAGYGNEGAEQDNVVGAKLLQAFAKIKEATGALVIGLDHYGKDISTGTRGGSAKEDAADFVVALLGDRDPSGKVTNRRMVLRKIRGAAAGAEHPFDLKVVDIGVDEDGDPDFGAVVDWDAISPPTTKRTNGGKDATTIRNIVLGLINDGHGELRNPFPDMAPVKCVKLDAVRAEFSRQYVGKGEDDPKKAHEAKRKAAYRAIENAKGKTITVRDDWCWLI